MNPRTYTLLLVEDQRPAAATIGAFLEGIGYAVDYASDGPGALRLAHANGYDAIVLDVGLPRLDGLVVCRCLREGPHQSRPILMISGKDTLDDRLAGISAGADDYLTKPFPSLELAARLRTLIRRSKGEVGSAIYRIGDLTLDTSTMTARRAEQPLALTETELRLLHILMRASPAYVSRQDLGRELWGAAPPATDALRSHLYKLRKAIDRPFSSALLHTRVDRGYRIASISGSAVVDV